MPSLFRSLQQQIPSYITGVVNIAAPALKAGQMLRRDIIFEAKSTALHFALERKCRLPLPCVKTVPIASSLSKPDPDRIHIFVRLDILYSRFSVENGKAIELV